MNERIVKIDNKKPRIPIDIYVSQSNEPSNLVCLSDRSIYVIRLLLHHYYGWHTIIGSYISDKLFRLCSDAEFAEFSEHIENLLEELKMNCYDGLHEIAQSIALLASGQQGSNTTVNVNSCCDQQLIDSGGGISGVTTQPSGGNEIPIYGSEPPIGIPPGEFPVGYADVQEYEADKCEIANLIVTGAIGTLRGLSTLSGANMGALAGLVAASAFGLIFFPPAVIPVAIAAIAFMAVEATILALLAVEIEENRDYWVCKLYDSASTEEAFSLIAELLDAAISTIGTTGALAWAVKQIGLLVFNGDVLNQLFKKTAHGVYDGADCSGCIDIDCPIFFLEAGNTLINRDGYTIEVGSLSHGSWHSIGIGLHYTEDGSSQCGPEMILEQADLTGWTSWGGNNFQLYNQAGTLYFSETVWTLPQQPVRFIQILSSTPFSAIVTVSEIE